MAINNFISPNLNSKTITLIRAAAIYDTTTINALDTFFNGLDSNALTAKIKAMWLCLGSTARTFALNAMDVNSYNLIYSGTSTISNTGIIFGTTGCADTQFIPSTNLTLNNTHFACYSRTSQQGANFEFGCNNGSSQRMLYRVRSSSNLLDSQMYDATLGSGALQLSAGSLNTAGLFTFSRTSSTSSVVYRNDVSFGSINTTGGALPSLSFALGGFKDSTGITPCNNTKSFCFFSIGNGLTATDVTNYYALIQALQTALGRQV